MKINDAELNQYENYLLAIELDDFKENVYEENNSLRSIVDYTKLCDEINT